VATNVSLLGPSGGTITLPISSASNAAVAQTALQGISDAVTAGTLNEVYETASGVPAPTQPSIVIAQPADRLPPIQLGNGYIGAVLNGDTLAAVVSGLAPNETIASGQSGALVANLAANTEVFFGGGDNALLEFGGFGLTPSAEVWLDGLGAFDLSAGDTTVFAGTGAALDLVNNGDGTNVVNFEETNPKAAANIIWASGASTTAATVNAVGAGLAVLQNGGAAVINAHASDVTVYGMPTAISNGQGRVTLYGGTGSTDIVADGTGYFQAGSGGNSLLFSSTVPGAATLVGGGPGDTLVAQGAGDLMVAGPGNEMLLGAYAPVTVHGYTGIEPAKAAIDMVGGWNGGNVFLVGNGITWITATHGADGGNVFAELTTGANNAVIQGFVSAQDPSGAPQADADVISLLRPGGGSYALEGGAPPQPGQVTFNYYLNGTALSTKVQFGDGTTWLLPGTILHPGDFR
jgi:hypothetical protein